jgi:hypothetical protein
LDGDGKPDLIAIGDKKIFAFHNESTAGAISFAAPVNDDQTKFFHDSLPYTFIRLNEKYAYT